MGITGRHRDITSDRLGAQASDALETAGAVCAMSAEITTGIACLCGPGGFALFLVAPAIAWP
jgi:hypothetical protein